MQRDLFYAGLLAGRRFGNALTEKGTAAASRSSSTQADTCWMRKPVTHCDPATAADLGPSWAVHVKSGAALRARRGSGLRLLTLPCSRDRRCACSCGGSRPARSPSACVQRTAALRVGAPSLHRSWRQGLQLRERMRRLVGLPRGAGLPMAIASGSSRAANVSVLRSAGLDDVISVVVSAEEVGRGKPAPDVFLEAARRLGAEPGRCVVVEDATPGVEAAYRAAMRCIAVPAGGTDVASFATASLVLVKGRRAGAPLRPRRLCVDLRRVRPPPGDSHLLLDRSNIVGSDRRQREASDRRRLRGGISGTGGGRRRGTCGPVAVHVGVIASVAHPDQYVLAGQSPLIDIRRYQGAGRTPACRAACPALPARLPEGCGAGRVEFFVQPPLTGRELGI